MSVRDIDVVAPVAVGAPVAPALDDRPPGERYYRHPGDVVRLVVWTVATLVLVLFIGVAVGTSDGVRSDLGGALTNVPLPARQLLLAIAQVGAVVVPIAVLGALALRGRWRRSGTLIVAAAAGAVVLTVVGFLLAEQTPVPGAVGDESWLISARFPRPSYLAAALSATTVGKPWMSRAWRRAADVACVALAVTMAVAGSAGVPELALAVTAGGLAGAALLATFGAPNRRPTPSAIAAGFRASGIDLDRLQLQRAVGGRSQLYRTETTDGPYFLKVYGQDSRDADLLYRSYRTLVLRHPGERWPSPSIAGDVEHEALMLLLAERGGVACPVMWAVVPLADGSMVLAMADVGGRRLDQLATEERVPELLAAVWSQTVALHRAGLAHRALRAANILVDDDGRPVVIDVGAATAGADRRLQAIDRAELLASLAALVGPDQAVASAAGVLDDGDLAAAMPYLQPLALSAATRRATPTSTLRDLRDAIAATTGQEAAPLERLVRVRPRTAIMIATLAGAFSILLPQLANVDDSVEAVGSADWRWLAGAVAMSVVTYVMAAIGMIGGVSQRLRLVTTVQVAMASSFVNRVTAANVGGMALNVRYLQKAGVPPAEAVTGVGLNVVAGGIVHAGLLVVFFAWAGRNSAAAFAIPSSSKLLVALVVILALVGVVLVSRRGRKLVRSHVVPSLRQSIASVVALGRSPSRLLVLFGGSLGVTLAYIAALTFTVAAFDNGVSFAQIGAVYLGASLIAAAAPTPGGLGAIEAALVAGLTGVGMDPAIAVAAVLTYRLVTFWLPVLPGWLFFRLLERHQYI